MKKYTVEEVKTAILNCSVDMTNKEYHKEYDHISSSKINKVIFDRQGFVFGREFPDFVSICADEGTLFHTMFGEPHLVEKEIEVKDGVNKWLFGNSVPTANPEWMKLRKQAYFNEKTLVTSADIEKMQTKVDLIKENPNMDKYLDNLLVERSFFGELYGKKAKVRPDLISIITDDEGFVTSVTILDIKTSGKAATKLNAELSCFTYEYKTALYMYSALVKAKLLEQGIDIPVPFDYLFVCRQKRDHSYNLFPSKPSMFTDGEANFKKMIEELNKYESKEFDLLEEGVLNG